MSEFVPIVCSCHTVVVHREDRVITPSDQRSQLKKQSLFKRLFLFGQKKVCANGEDGFSILPTKQSDLKQRAAAFGGVSTSIEQEELLSAEKNYHVSDGTAEAAPSCIQFSA